VKSLPPIARGQWAAGTAAQAGRELGRGGFGPLAFDLFFYLLNIFKSLRIQKFVYDSFKVRKL
jgi:hypothetical protein